jgi:hypothetical protein
VAGNSKRKKTKPKRTKRKRKLRSEGRKQRDPIRHIIDDSENQAVIID